jgi:hypothetical protein
MLFFSVFVEILSPKNLTQYAGEDVKIMFNTTLGNFILAANLGLEGDRECPDPKFITVIIANQSVTANQSVACSSDLNVSKAASYKGRVNSIGNLTKGQAWFEITNLTMNDTNRYLACIREDSSEKYKPFSFNLTVTQKGNLNTVVS